ncbi:unnamed protein product [Ambrosiozyma monospora]|uniref:Unnamed protein product n=1 Tax=Ambrosiozyma monospora TaxID=43982 RepID=A0ACB5SUH4_AMBMO|nr:unnamed protein product [Ambrosiozyma monospora]
MTGKFGVSSLSTISAGFNETAEVLIKIWSDLTIESVEAAGNSNEVRFHGVLLFLYVMALVVNLPFSIFGNGMVVDITEYVVAEQSIGN